MHSIFKKVKDNEVKPKLSSATTLITLARVWVRKCNIQIEASNSFRRKTTCASTTFSMPWTAHRTLSANKLNQSDCTKTAAILTLWGILVTVCKCSLNCHFTAREKTSGNRHHLRITTCIKIVAACFNKGKDLTKFNRLLKRGGQLGIY